MRSVIDGLQNMPSMKCCIASLVIEISFLSYQTKFSAALARIENSLLQPYTALGLDEKEEEEEKVTLSLKTSR